MNYKLRIKKNTGRQTLSLSKGYTIIETMIAVSIFLIVVMIGMGALLNANLLHQKSQDTRSIMDNLSFILEDMSRNLRTGYDYRCITDATVNGDLSHDNIVQAKSGSGCWGIAFEYAKGDTNPYNDPASFQDQWVYYIDNTGKIFKSTQGPYTTFPSNYVQLTPNEVIIDTTASGFSIIGAEPPSLGDQQQPFVTIKLVGTIKLKNSADTPFSLQTSVSQRQIDI